MKSEYPRAHVQKLSLLKERLEQGGLAPPIYGTASGGRVAESFVIRRASEVEFKVNGSGRRCVCLPHARGGTLVLGADEEYQLKFSRDGKGRAIFLTNLNQ